MKIKIMYLFSVSYSRKYLLHSKTPLIMNLELQKFVDRGGKVRRDKSRYV